MSKSKIKLLSMFLVIAMLLITMSMTVFAEDDVAMSGTCGAEGNESDVTWAFEETTGILTISGTGAMADYTVTTSGKGASQETYYCVTDTPWISYADSITSIVLDEGITYIGKGAFSALENLEKFPWQEEGYANTTLTSIGDFAFTGAYAVTEATFSATVTSYGMYVFEGSGVTTVDWTNYNQASTISDKLLIEGIQVATGLFAECPNLTEISLPEKVTVIDRAAFRNTGITSFDFTTDAPNVYVIEESAFAGCSSLTILTLPTNENTMFGASVFSSTGVTSVSIPAYTNPFQVVGSVEGGASLFKSCSELVNVEISEGITKIPNSAFHGCPIATLSLPSTLVIIEAYAFSDLAMTGTLTIPEGCEVEIQNFMYMTGTEKVIIEDSVVLGTKDGVTGADASDNIYFLSNSNVDILVIGDDVTTYGVLGAGTTSIHTVVLGDNLTLEHSGKLLSSANGDVTIYVSDSTKTLDPSAYYTNSTTFAITNGGTFADDTTFTAGELAAPSKVGYIFTGWFDNEELTGEAVTTATAGETYYASYELCESHVYETVVTPPTCIDKGYTTYTCSLCAYSYIEDYVDATGVCVDENGDDICDICGADLSTESGSSSGLNSLTSFWQKIIDFFNSILAFFQGLGDLS